MWILKILLRLLVAAGGALYRYFKGDPSLRGERHRHKGFEYCVYPHTHKGNVVRIELGIPFTGPKLKFVVEGTLDRLFKALGLSTEFQTGDRDFDSRVYIVCDHPQVKDFLEKDLEARQLIFDVLAGDFTEIRSDGSYLWFKSGGPLEAREEDLDRLVELKKRVGKLESSGIALYRDPFIARALAVEVVIWSVAAYAAAAYIDFLFSKQTLFLTSSNLMRDGLLMGGILFLLLYALSWALLRGSSRGHRVLIESAIVLALSLPIAGIQLIADINTGLDPHPVREFEGTIASKTSYTSGSGRSRTTHYKLNLQIENPSYPYSRTLEVGHFLYSDAAQGRKVLLEVGEGALGYPWLRSLSLK